MRCKICDYSNTTESIYNSSLPHQRQKKRVSYDKELGYEVCSDCYNTLDRYEWDIHELEEETTNRTSRNT